MSKIKESANIITDDMLEPYFLVAENGRIKAYKKKQRKKADGSIELINSEIATSTKLLGALKSIVEDAFSYKRNVMITTGEYVKAYGEMLDRLKSKFKIQDNDYI